MNTKQLQNSVEYESSNRKRNVGVVVFFLIIVAFSVGAFLDKDAGYIMEGEGFKAEIFPTINAINRYDYADNGAGVIAPITATSINDITYIEGFNGGTHEFEVIDGVEAFSYFTFNTYEGSHSLKVSTQYSGSKTIIRLNKTFDLGKDYTTNELFYFKYEDFDEGYIAFRVLVEYDVFEHWITFLLVDHTTGGYIAEPTEYVDSDQLGVEPYFWNGVVFNNIRNVIIENLMDITAIDLVVKQMEIVFNVENERKNLYLDYFQVQTNPAYISGMWYDQDNDPITDWQLQFDYNLLIDTDVIEDLETITFDILLYHNVSWDGNEPFILNSLSTNLRLSDLTFTPYEDDIDDMKATGNYLGNLVPLPLMESILNYILDFEYVLHVTLTTNVKDNHLASEAKRIIDLNEFDFSVEFKNPIYV